MLQAYATLAELLGHNEAVLLAQGQAVAGPFQPIVARQAQHSLHRANRLFGTGGIEEGLAFAQIQRHIDAALQTTQAGMIGLPIDGP